MKLLVSVDGSPQSHEAFEFALSMAKDHDHLFILSAWRAEPPVVEVEKNPEGVFYCFSSQAQKHLDDFCQWATEEKKPHTPIFEEVPQGKQPADIIAEQASEHEVDLIVTGRRDPNLSDIAISQSSQLVRKARCSVLVVKQGQRRDSMKVERGARVLASIDGSDVATRALKTALDLCDPHVDKITIVTHVKSSKEAKRAAAKANLEASAAICNERGMENETRMLCEGDVREALFELVEAEHYDMVVIGTRGLGKVKQLILGSVCVFCLENLSCSVLFCPRNPA